MINYFIENLSIDFEQIENLCEIYNVSFKDFKDYFSSRKVIDANNDKQQIVFCYVGLISFGDLILFILPKYIKNISNNDYNIKHSKLIIKVLDKYVEVKKNLLNDELETLDFTYEKLKYNKITMFKYFITDYIEHGLYSSSKLKYEKNGTSSIDWGKTIQYNNMIISNGTPIYVDVLTIKKNVDQDCVIRMIHKYILTQAIEFFIKLDLFDFNVNFSDYSEFPYDNKEYISNLLNNRLNTEFIDRNIRLIKSMKAYIDKEQFNYDNNEINLYGTREFEYVWEEINAHIFDNNYKKLIAEIEKPILFKYGSTEENKTKGALKPDIVKLGENNDVLYIIDAKYYDFYFQSNGKIVGEYPKSYDIVKQLAYESKLKRRNLSDKIINAFVIPSLYKTESVGYVNFDLFDTDGKIHIININVEEAYDKFLNDKLIDISKINFKKE
ncbi:LlaJI family restriction endonuclease [Clostridium sporogenes]|uniref:LlaJI family restriction endonuclease n=1 Tax=Clostridium sporogenes TaxID=1509 RepID=UPI0013C7F0FE|nr:LlaJI family restriction endonuclease [Clostridium sporogenes]NFT38914.1 LlaJI family restriction endonuclease [Clostridium sporogenes]NFT53633.1 LlaJI family restriction endonuclease [Clostridium sporogenes]NFT74049.1 LlaJI family restriction endonuclease [Clostridium sporogenes]